MPSSSDVVVASPSTNFGCRENYLQFLPAELIHQIAEHVSEDLVITTARDLLSLALTCKRFCLIAIRLLYKFNERLSHVWCHNSWLTTNGPFCDIHRGFHRPALKWAIERSRLRTLRAVFIFTPKLYDSSHVQYAMRFKKYDLARSMLRLQPVIDELKAGITRDSPIFASVESGHQPLIDDITEIQGVDFEQTHCGMSVLDYACKMGNWDLARRFLDQGANPYHREVTSLQQGIECSDAEAGRTVVKGILTLRPDVRFISNASQAAVRLDRPDILEIFMERGVIDQAFEGAPGHLGDLFEQAIRDGSTSVYRKLLSIYPNRLLTERRILDVLELTSRQWDDDKDVQMAEWLISHIRKIPDNDLSFFTYEKLKAALSLCVIFDLANWRTVFLACLMVFDLVKYHVAEQKDQS